MQYIKDQDWELIKKVQAGNKPAFNELILKYQYKIFKLLNFYIKDRHDCLDLVQEVFLKAYTAIASFKHKSSFYTWLYKIAINTAKTHITNHNRRKLLKYSCESAVQEDYYINKEFNDPNDNLDRIIIFNELEDVFFRALNELPIELKNTLILRELDGLSYEQIAEISTCPVGTVRSRIFRAREAIEKHFHPYKQG